MKQLVRLSLGSVLAISLALAGCGESTPHGYVSGNLLFEGGPVPTGTRVFFEQSHNGVIAAGVIDENGLFSLNHQGSTKIPLGDYVVYVGPPKSNMTEQEYSKLKAKVDAEYRRRGEKPPTSPDWVLPQQYYQGSTSPLRETVDPGENRFEIALSK